MTIQQGPRRLLSMTGTRWVKAQIESKCQMFQLVPFGAQCSIDSRDIWCELVLTRTFRYQ